MSACGRGTAGDNRPARRGPAERTGHYTYRHPAVRDSFCGDHWQRAPQPDQTRRRVEQQPLRILSTTPVTTALLTVLAVSVALLLAVVLPVNNQPAPDGIAMVTQQTQSDSYGVDFAEIPNHEDLTQQRLEYFRISENSPGNDVDSVLQFAVTPQATEQSSDANSPHVAYDHVSSESVVVPFIASSENLQQQTEQDFLPVAPLGSVDPINSPTDRNSSRFWSLVAVNLPPKHPPHRQGSRCIHLPPFRVSQQKPP
ncbi:MAG: hypothetical protein R3B91_16950 [Planctomycetaceae bacterium]